MRWVKLLACLTLLTGCSLGPLIDVDVIDYFEVNDRSANRIILLNILRAKDRAPLHFAELSLVRGQMSAGLTAGVTFPFGPLLHASSPRRGAAISSTLSTAPSFDVGSLDTKDFTNGVMAKISPASVKFFFDEGIDYQLLMLLLVAGVRTPGNQEIILNEPESARAVCYSEDVAGRVNALPQHYAIVAPGEGCPNGRPEPEFYAFLRVMNHLRRIYATDYAMPAEPVGPPFSLDMRTDLRSIAAMDPTKYQLHKLPSGQYQLFAAARQQTVVLCQEPPPGGTPSVLVALRGGAGVTPIPASACGAHPPPEPLAAVDPNPSATPALELLTVRSTLEVIQYIGRLLEFQERESARAGAPRCVTLGFERQNPGCDGNVLFHLQHDGAESSIELNYGGQHWAVPPSRACDDVAHCDHSLETMAIVALLLNQNKSAKDLPITPAFQAVP